MLTKIIAIYATSLTDAISFINNNKLQNDFMQLEKDLEMKNSYWIIFKMSDARFEALFKQYPRLSVRI